MKTPHRTPREALRLEELHKYHVLDTQPEQALEDLTALAAHICQAPIALISLVDEHRQWFKSKFGLRASETPRHGSFCGHAILQPDLFVVQDATEDQRFADNPLVTLEPHIRFYAGSPLVTAKGHTLGTLCVMDSMPRQLNASQQDALGVLSRQVMAQLELRRQTLELSEQETRLRLALDAAHMGTFDWDIPRDHITWSRGHELLWGFQSGEFGGTFEAAAARLHPDDLNGFSAEISRCLAARAPFRHEFRVVWFDGTVHWIESLGEFTYDPSGQPDRMRGVVLETTKRRGAEQALRDSEAQYRTLVESASDAILVSDAQGHLLDANATGCRMFGYSLDELLTMRNTDLVVSSEAARLALEASRLNASGVVSSEWQCRRKDGSLFTGAFSATVLPDGRRLGILRDVTERKRADEALQLMRLCVDHAGDGVFWISPAGQVLYVNEAACQRLGYSESELLAMEVFDLDPGFPRANWESHWERLQACGSMTFETFHRTKAGQVYPVEVNANCLQVGAKALNFSFVRDITERKRAEAALLASEASLAAAQARAHLGSWELDLLTSQGTWSAEMSRLYYRDPALDTPPLEEFLDLVHSEDRAIILDVQSRIPKATEPIHYEHRTNPSLGPVRHLSASMLVLRDAAGCAVRAVGTSLDITKHKRAELRIQQLNRTYAVLSDINQAIVRDKDPQVLLTTACRIAVGKGQFLLAWIGLVDATGQRFEITAHAGATDDSLQTLRALVDSALLDRDGLAPALRTGQHCICNDTERDPPKSPWCTTALQEGIRSMVSLPLKIDADVIGTFNLYAKTADFFDEEELCLLDELALDISFALEVNRNETMRRTAEDGLRWKTAFLEAQVDSSLDGIGVVDNEGKKLLQNQRMNELWKIPPEIVEQEDDAVQVQFIANQTKNPQQFAARIAHLNSHCDEINRDVVELIDGTVLDQSSSPVRDKYGKYYGRIWVFRDITEQRKLEQQFRQSQKMEAIGQLAGGVAHDFNNLLSVILGYGSLLLVADELSSESKDSAQQIISAAERAATLTRQLLAFSRRQVMQLRQLDLNVVVTNLTKMLQRIVGEDVRLQLNLHPNPLLTRADAGMLDQVLLNLVVNARDAMPGGGRLYIETSERSFTEEQAAALPESSPGRHVCLRVTDTGSGIAPELLSQIFDPFFTTKGPSKGTGLGLATVFGIVKQHGGSLSVESEVGRGTTFQIYLPTTEATGESSVEVIPKAKPRGGTETILLVEDDYAVRMLTCAVLERVGYRVLKASHGVAALKIAEQHQDAIHLLFTDIVMPEDMSGLELAARLQARMPALRVIFTSGYSADIAGRELTLQLGQNFIQKPASPQELLETVRRCLDG